MDRDEQKKNMQDNFIIIIVLVRRQFRKAKTNQSSGRCYAFFVVNCISWLIWTFANLFLQWLFDHDFRSDVWKHHDWTIKIVIEKEIRNDCDKFR